jgi:hypothetical protein
MPGNPEAALDLTGARQERLFDVPDRRAVRSRRRFAVGAAVAIASVPILAAALRRVANWCLVLPSQTPWQGRSGS